MVFLSTAGVVAHSSRDRDANVACAAGNTTMLTMLHHYKRIERGITTHLVTRSFANASINLGWLSGQREP